MPSLFQIETLASFHSCPGITVPYYSIIFFEEQASFTIDFTSYDCNGKTIFFLSPFQLLTWHFNTSPVIYIVRFHSDFYCIEYHKEEVACNGILFNNIYEKPCFPIPDTVYEDIIRIFFKMKELENTTLPYDLSVIKSYLQLILALSSKEKQKTMLPQPTQDSGTGAIAHFNTLLEAHFTAKRNIAFYAGQYGLALTTFSRKIKNHFGKTPSKLIRERLTLEAKRQLHLTYKSIKEIAGDLGFEDEFYFSRYFKKEVGVSPKKFRETTGISIAAK